MELQQNPAAERRRDPALRDPALRDPALRDLMDGLLNVSWLTLTALVAASVGLALVAVPPVPLLAYIIFSVVWAVTLVALFGKLARGAERRRHHPVAH